MLPWVLFAFVATAIATTTIPSCFEKLGENGLKTCALWPVGGVPGERVGMIGPEGRLPEPAGDFTIFNVTNPTLELYIVSGSDAAIIIAPGGGYEVLAYLKEGQDVAAWANSIGVSAFVLKYRVPNRNWLGFGTAALMDAQRAMSLVRWKSAQLSLDPSKIGFMGFSAGGHLTAYISNLANRVYHNIDVADSAGCRPNFAIMIYPWRLVNDDNPDVLNFLLTSQTPPTLLIHTEADSVAPVENSLTYMRGLHSAKVQLSELHVFALGRHGFGLCRFPENMTQLPVCSWPQLASTYLHGFGVGLTLPEIRL